MARPRVFVSSTFYDLKHVRSSLDIFIDSLGYDSILSEKGDIAYSHEVPLDESCYREVSTADIFVLVIGGRYGSSASREMRDPSKLFFDRYESVTKLEHDEAVKRDIPIYILVESPVYAEYQTYLRNKDSKSISYAHVDSVNVFILLEEILNRRRNNPVKTFERFSDIESWLREQWAGLFREFLHRTSSQQQIAALTDQVAALQEVSGTLKRYLEAVVTKLSPDASAALIRQEETRLSELKALNELRDNNWMKHTLRMTRLHSESGMSLEDVRDAIARSKSFVDFGTQINDALGSETIGADLADILNHSERARKDFNDVRIVLGLPPLNCQKEEDMSATISVAAKKKRKSNDKDQELAE
ncbi:MAG: DUF4062 domain-containing protein [Pirellulaceae bacterium]|nr:DUF4062 domain-containing protein [Pirellulaceae bacterium]